MMRCRRRLSWFDTTAAPDSEGPDGSRQGPRSTQAEARMREEKLSFCRFCHAFCGIKVTVEEGRAVKVIGDVDNPLYRGFTCVKGRALPDQHYSPARLLHSMKRDRDGDL